MPSLQRCMKRGLLVLSSAVKASNSPIMRAARSNAASAAPRRLTYARGFTLAEMAVVLVIVALLIAGMMLPLSAQQDIRARQETATTLVGFAAAKSAACRARPSRPRTARSAHPAPAMPTAADSFPGPRSACTSSTAGTS
ncbi:MAG: hypothetical protein B6D47_12090 [Rhodocyclaceae bacterium UTPRO2]|nr:MAG: hypothetical protein B6D47_12090 [Rhodocyclaceae bacterium UTPRO2]